MHSFVLRFFAIVSLLGGLAYALPHAFDDAHIIKNQTIKGARSANTCADPSLAQPILEATIDPEALHRLDFRASYETSNAVSSAKGAQWTDIHPVFFAWPTQQDFTSPLFRLQSSDFNQEVYAIGANAATPPVISGFTQSIAVIAWVYNSQVCGSVPLMSATFTGATDNYFTTSASVHAGLIAQGWVDTGVIAFVLPLDEM